MLSAAEGKILDIARPTIIQTKKKKVAEKVRVPVHERNYKGSNVQVRILVLAAEACVYNNQ